MSNENWIRVTKPNPCPICRKPDWCLIAKDGTAAICQRIESERCAGDAGFLHKLGTRDVDPCHAVKTAKTGKTVKTGESRTTIDSAVIENEARHVAENTKPEKLTELASNLGVSVESLRRLGVGWSPDRNAWLFPLTDACGQVVGIQRRIANGDKRVIKGHRLGLYLPSGLNNNGPLLIAEGASDTAALLTLGFDAVGRFNCGTGTQMLIDLVDRLQPPEVIIVADPDGPGQKGATALAVAIRKNHHNTKVITPPDGRDIRGWVNSGATKQAIEQLVNESKYFEMENEPKTNGLTLTSFAEIQAKPTEWLWPDRIPLGTISMVVGQQGDGKTQLMLDIAARVSNGRDWPDTPDQMNTPGSVVILSAEDDPHRTLRPRLDQAGATVERVHLMQSSSGIAWVNLKRDMAELETLIRNQEDVRLVIIDPVTAYMGEIDDNNNSQTRSLLGPLTKLAEEQRFALVLISHLSKRDTSNALHRVMGSTAYTAAARSVWLVTIDPNDPDVPPRRLLLHAKSNLAPMAPGLAYRIEDNSVKWCDGIMNMTADEALRARRAGSTSKREEVASWLRELLVDGPSAANDVLEQARARGYSEGMVRGVFKELGGISSPDGFQGPRLWSLPQESVSLASVASLNCPVESDRTEQTGSDWGEV